MLRLPVVMVIFCLGAFFSGCRGKQPIVVHVFRDSDSPLGRELDRRFYQLNAMKLSLSSGQRIVIATLELSQDYKRMLGDRVVSELRPELVNYGNHWNDLFHQ